MNTNPHWNYQSIEEPCSQAACGITYGISVTAAGKPPLLLHDLTPDPKLITHLTEIFNRTQPDPIHLQELVEDALC